MTSRRAGELLENVLKVLKRTYGPRRRRRWGKAVDMLVGTILSQNTSDANSSAGFQRLTDAFATWDDVADAPVAAIERCIRVSGLSRIKAPRIRNILRQVRTERGSIDLEFLAEMPPVEAAEALLRFQGVGPKTALCVLLFALGMPVFPVDTHIHRIAQRLGVLPPGTSADRAHEVLTPLIRPGDRYAMHVLLIAHGRAICKAQKPRCMECRVLQYCKFGARNVRRRGEGKE